LAVARANCQGAAAAAAGDADVAQTVAWESFDALFEEEERTPKARPPCACAGARARSGRRRQQTTEALTRSPLSPRPAQRATLAPPAQFAERKVVCARCYALEHYGCAPLQRSARNAATTHTRRLG
jgi:hypothetical protein